MMPSVTTTTTWQPTAEADKSLKDALERLNKSNDKVLIHSKGEAIKPRFILGSRGYFSALPKDMTAISSRLVPNEELLTTHHRSAGLCIDRGGVPAIPVCLRGQDAQVFIQEAHRH